MALKDKLMTLEDFKAVRDVDVASNSAQFTEIKADLGDVKSNLGNIANLDTSVKTSIVDAINAAQADIDDAKTDLGTLFKWVTISGWVSDGFVDVTTVSPVVLTPSQQPNEPQWRCVVLDCAEGDTFLLNIVGGYSRARAWAFLDNTNTVISMYQGQTALSNAQIVAPEGAVKLALNDNGSGGMCYKRENKADSAVKYDEAQTLTNEEKAVARTNIGAASQADISEIVNNSQTFAIPYEFFTAITSLLEDAYYRSGANPAALDSLRDATALYVYDGCVYISRYYNGLEAVKSCRTLITY